MHSALKRDGKALYEYAREGIVLEREAREVTIHELEIISYQVPYLNLRVKCSKGTYVRVLGEDIGTALGCGAHLQALRRIAVGELSLVNAITLEALSLLPDDERLASLLAADFLLSSFPMVVLPEALALRFLQGQRLSLPKEGICVDSNAQRVRVYKEADKQLLGTAQIREFGVLAPERLIKSNNNIQ
jgi:tRNA pseudouridine55 synthase